MGATVTWYGVTSSTNDRANEGAASGAPHGAVYVADAQSAGRGRLGRVWQSPAGAGLYCSVVLDVPARVVPFVTLTAGVAVADGVRESAGLTVQLKWPNDIWVDGRKLGGILAELTTAGAAGSRLVVGIGLNVAAAALPPEVAGLATSLEAELGRVVDRGVLLAELLVALEQRITALAAGRDPEILQTWRVLAAPLMGRPVEWDEDGAVRTGLASRSGDDGALVVETATGEVRLRAGEVRWR
jgi:BirA family biotin operon repressor/biotin-[acetyl-CoA-carboxylase] ligase